jgi:UPF0755 protein
VSAPDRSDADGLGVFDFDEPAAAPRPPAPAGPGGSRRRARRRRWPLVLAAMVVAVLIVAGSGLVWAESQINPGGRRGPQTTVVIPPGASTAQIAQVLADHGIIHSATLFTLYVRFHGDGPLLPGTYHLERNSPYSGAISALEAGPKVLVDRLTIPPGFTLAQIAARVGALPGLGLSAAKFMAAATDGTVTSPFEPPGVHNLEGLVWPDTYDVSQGETEVDILQQLVGQFDAEAASIGLDAAAARLGYSPYQVIEVASIVEREAKLPGDRPYVASAIYNRLRAGMPLGADSTQTYYLRLSDPTLEPTVAQLDQPSPYNTRLNRGLPPTPIASPGLASLQAAADPASTSYLYFVEINPDGQLGFASTEAGFEQLQTQCRAAGLC